MKARSNSRRAIYLLEMARITPVAAILDIKFSVIQTVIFDLLAPSIPQNLRKLQFYTLSADIVYFFFFHAYSWHEIINALSLQ